MSRIAIAVAVALLGATPAAAGWTVPPAGYTFIAAAGCEKPNRAPSIYDACADQMRLFTEARTRAFAEKKTLLVVFGATWCPSCRTMKTALPSPEVMGRTFQGRPLGDRVEVVEIAISTLAGSKMVSVPSGEAVHAGLKAARPEFVQRTIPFIAVVDPVTGRTSARNLDDLEARNGGWNRDALATVIADADTEARGGRKAPGEPGWLMRKWQRWFGQ